MLAVWKRLLITLQRRLVRTPAKTTIAGMQRHALKLILFTATAAHAWAPSDLRAGSHGSRWAATEGRAVPPPEATNADVVASDLQSLAGTYDAASSGAMRNPW